MSRVLNPLLTRLLGWEAHRMRRVFTRSLARCEHVQRKFLMARLQRNAASSFGRDHGFGSIRTIDDFRKAVPVSTYDDYRPYIERVRRGEVSAMFGRGQKVRMFAMTSGTTNKPKYVPVSTGFLKEYRRGWMVWGINAFADHPQVWEGRILQLVSAMDDETAPCGLPCGAMSGLTAQVQRKAARNLYALPACCAAVKDTPSKHYVALLLALRQHTLTILSANPSTLLALARTMDERKEQLLCDLRDGTLSEGLDLPGPVRQALGRRLRAEPGRCRELETIIRRTGTLYPKDAWRLPLLGCWKGGTLTLYLREFPRYFGDAPVRDIGLIASEGRMTIPLSDDGSSGALDLGAAFFEFLPAAGGRPAGDRTLLPNELEVGGQYFLVLTSSAGLYRYNIGDLVRVTGFVAGSPMLEFLSKGAHYSNLTGEKLSEHQLVGAVDAALSETGLALASYCLAATWGSPAACYSFLVEESSAGDRRVLQKFLNLLEERLRADNIEYDSKRQSERLGPIRAKVVADGTWLKYDMATIAERRRGLEQYKHKFLVGDVEFERKFAAVAGYEEISAVAGKQGGCRRAP
ncbi:MAG: GH3 auxin-responsive promoter [Anaerolineaceae bacterium]|nr:GH3 auxin-responsive promoter [Anaerolineaceae bacterium]